MSIRELDLVSRQFKSSQDATVIRKDINLYQSDIKKESADFLAEIEKISKKERKSKVIGVAILYSD